MFGFSVWWVLVAFAYAWLASLVRWMRGSHSAEAAAVAAAPPARAPAAFARPCAASGSGWAGAAAGGQHGAGVVAPVPF